VRIPVTDIAETEKLQTANPLCQQCRSLFPEFNDHCLRCNNSPHFRLQSETPVQTLYEVIADRTIINFSALIFICLVIFSFSFIP